MDQRQIYNPSLTIDKQPIPSLACWGHRRQTHLAEIVFIDCAIWGR
ncbi:MAG: hypothetical protein PHV95_05945 [Eubacteriales bacterium]|nr:hypothetical protein [Eubacteriales bacterium]